MYRAGLKLILFQNFVWFFFSLLYVTLKGKKEAVWFEPV